MNDSVDHVLQKLIADPMFRRMFYADPLKALRDTAAPLSTAEIMALLSVPEIYFDEFARGLPSHIPEEDAPRWEAATVSRQH